MSLSVASLTWADIASDSNADNEIVTMDFPVFLSSDPVTCIVGKASSYVDFDLVSSSDVPFYFLTTDSLHPTLIQIFNWVDNSWEPHANYNPDFFLDESGFWISSSSMMHSKYVIPMYLKSGQRIKVRYIMGTYNQDNVYYDLEYSRYKIADYSGLYDTGDKKVSKSVHVRYFGPTISSMNGLYHSLVYPVTSNADVVGLQFADGNGVLKAGFEYTFRFKHSIKPLSIDAVGIDIRDSSLKLGDEYSYYRFVPEFDTLMTSFYFQFKYNNAMLRGSFFGIDDITSSYIPASDTGQQGQTTAANTTVIKNVVTNISNTVSNISNQITNTTNTITNTITNTTNQIKEAVNQSANQISQTVTNTSNQIKDSVNQSAEKISQTVTNKVNEVNGTINSVGQKTQEKIDDTKKAVVDKLEDTKTGIITGIIDGLKSLFIPSDDFFKTWFDDMYSFFDERLGFLMLPVDLLVNLIDIVVSADSSNAGIPFPEIKWEGTVLIPAQTVRIEIFDTDFGKDLQDKLYFVGNVIMIGALLSLMYRKFEEVLRS